MLFFRLRAFRRKRALYQNMFVFRSVIFESFHRADAMRTSERDVQPYKKVDVDAITLNFVLLQVGTCSGVD